MKLACVAVLTIVAAADWNGLAAAQDLTEFWQKHRRSVVRIQTTWIDSQGTQQSETGTGFIVHPSGYIVTAAHVIDPKAYRDAKATAIGDMQRTISIDYRKSDDTLGTWRSGSGLEIKNSDTRENVDLAVLKVSPDGQELRAVRMSVRSAWPKGMPVRAIGWGSEAAEHDSFPLAGTLTRSSDEGTQGLVRIDMNLRPGDSGGPVFDEQGQLVGVTLHQRQGQTGFVNLAPAHLIKGMGVPESPSGFVIFRTNSNGLRDIGAQVEISKNNLAVEEVPFEQVAELEPDNTSAYQARPHIFDTRLDHRIVSIKHGGETKEVRFDYEVVATGRVIYRDATGAQVEPVVDLVIELEGIEGASTRTRGDGGFTFQKLPLAFEYPCRAYFSDGRPGPSPTKPYTAALQNIEWKSNFRDELAIPRQPPQP